MRLLSLVTGLGGIGVIVTTARISSLRITGPGSSSRALISICASRVLTNPVSDVVKTSMPSQIGGIDKGVAVPPSPLSSPIR